MLESDSHSFYVSPAPTFCVIKNTIHASDIPIDEIMNIEYPLHLKRKNIAIMQVLHEIIWQSRYIESDEHRNPSD